MLERLKSASPVNFILLTPKSSDHELTSHDIWCGQVVFKMFLTAG